MQECVLPFGVVYLYHILHFAISWLTFGKIQHIISFTRVFKHLNTMATFSEHVAAMGTDTRDWSGDSIG